MTHLFSERSVSSPRKKMFKWNPFSPQDHAFVSAAKFITIMYFILCSEIDKNDYYMKTIFERNALHISNDATLHKTTPCNMYPITPKCTAWHMYKSDWEIGVMPSPLATGLSTVTGRLFLPYTPFQLWLYQSIDPGTGFPPTRGTGRFDRTMGQNSVCVDWECPWPSYGHN